jgi:hypothetical protein
MSIESSTAREFHGVCERTLAANEAIASIQKELAGLWEKVQDEAPSDEDVKRAAVLMDRMAGWYGAISGNVERLSELVRGMSATLKREHPHLFE